MKGAKVTEFGPQEMQGLNHQRFSEPFGRGYPFGPPGEANHSADYFGYLIQQKM